MRTRTALLFVTCCLLLTTTAPAGAQTADPPPVTVDWLLQFDLLGGYDEISDIALGPDVVVAAGDAGARFGGLSGFVRAYSPAGVEQWTATYGPPLTYTCCTAIDAAGNIYVAGFTYGSFAGETNLGYGDAFLLVFDSSGNRLRTEQFGTAANDRADALAVTPDGGVLVAGRTRGAFPGRINAGGHDIFVRKYDGLGNEMWTHQFGTLREDAMMKGLAVDAAGAIYVGGYGGGVLSGEVSPYFATPFIRKLAADGTEVWTRWHDPLGEYAYGHGMALQGSDLLYVGEDPGWVTKFDASGSILWSDVFSVGPDYTWAAEPALTPDGSIVTTGTTWYDPWDDGDAYLRMYTGDGTPLWTYEFGTDEFDWIGNVAVDASGAIYVAGGTAGSYTGEPPPGTYRYDAVLIKFVPNPEYALDGLVDLMDEFDLDPAVAATLAPSLDTAAAILADGNPNNDAAAVGALQAFINKVEAQAGKKIPADVAAALVAAASDVIDQITG